jgi:hypothetical protein
LVMFRIIMQRVGADLWIFTSTPAGQESAVETFLADNMTAAGNLIIAMVAPDFTTTQTLMIKATLSAAHATFYLKPQVARIVRHGL